MDVPFASGVTDSAKVSSNGRPDSDQRLATLTTAVLDSGATLKGLVDEVNRLRSYLVAALVIFGVWFFWKLERA